METGLTMKEIDLTDIGRKIKAVFVDVDGTTFRHDTYEVPALTMKALTEIKASGRKLVLLSSRTPQEAIHLPQNYLDLMDAVILSAGSMIRVGNEITELHEIDPIDVKTAVEFCRANDIVLRYCTGPNGYYDGVVTAESDDDFYYLYRIVPERKAWTGESCINLLFYCSDETVNQLEKDLINCQLTRMVSAHEITRVGVNKSTALVHQCARWGIDPKDAVAFGDGYNDIGMLTTAGISFAMGNASDDVKRSAKYVCAPIDEDGFYKACRQLGLVE